MHTARTNNKMITKLKISALLKTAIMKGQYQGQTVSAAKELPGCLTQLAVSQTPAVDRHGADTSLIDKAVRIILQ